VLGHGLGGVEREAGAETFTDQKERQIGMFVVSGLDHLFEIFETLLVLHFGDTSTVCGAAAGLVQGNRLIAIIGVGDAFITA
jgi:hypothetical protein